MKADPQFSAKKRYIEVGEFMKKKMQARDLRINEIQEKKLILKELQKKKIELSKLSEEEVFLKKKIKGLVRRDHNERKGKEVEISSGNSNGEKFYRNLKAQNEALRVQIVAANNRRFLLESHNLILETNEVEEIREDSEAIQVLIQAMKELNLQKRSRVSRESDSKKKSRNKKSLKGKNSIKKFLLESKFSTGSLLKDKKKNFFPILPSKNKHNFLWDSKPKKKTSIGKVKQKKIISASYEKEPSWGEKDFRKKRRRILAKEKRPEATSLDRGIQKAQQRNKIKLKPLNMLKPLKLKTRPLDFDIMNSQAEEISFIKRKLSKKKI